MQHPNVKTQVSLIPTILLLVAVIALVAVGVVLLSNGGEERGEPVIATVGSYAITEEALHFRMAQVDIYYPGSGVPEVALAQLVQGYLSAELLKREGAELDHDALLAEAQRIDRQTRDPERLAQIKAVYGENRDAFLRTGILPDFAQSRLFAYFRKEARYSSEAKTTADAFLAKAQRNPEGYGELAEGMGASPRRFHVDPEEGMTPITETDGGVDDGGAPGMIDASPKSPEEQRLRADMQRSATEQDLAAARSLLERLAPLTEGQVYRNTLETPDSYQTARLISREGDGAIVEMAGFLKPDFGQWFWGEARAIPIQIEDPALRNSFRNKVSWAGDLNFK